MSGAGFVAVAVAAVALIGLRLRRWLRRRPRRGRVLIDGSNVMYWKDDMPRIATVAAVVRALEAEGHAVGVFFDANAGYLLAGRWLDGPTLARQLGLRPGRVRVVDKGTPADPALLAAAREMGARVVSNDRFRDWETDFPEVLAPGHVLRGRFRGDRPEIDAVPERA